MSELIQLLYAHPALFCLISFGLGWAFMPIVLRVAHVKNLVVKPNKRMSHKGEVPNIGGIDIFISFLLTCLIFEYDKMHYSQYILIGVFLMLMVGFIDDMLVIRPWQKVIGELLAGCFLIVAAGQRIGSLQGLCGVYGLSPWVSYLISFFVFIGITNAINLIDGVDGLASGLGICYCLFFAVYFSLAGLPDLAVLAYRLIGALLVFFIYNVFGNGRTKIFMGDSGSLTLGYMLSFFVFEFCRVNAEGAVPAPLVWHGAPGVVICLLAVPLFDTIRVMLTRIRKGLSPFSPDKNHVHHLLLKIGLSHLQVTAVLLCFTLLSTAVGLLCRQWNWGWTVLLMFALCCAAIWVLWRIVDRHSANRPTPHPNS